MTSPTLQWSLPEPTQIDFTVFFNNGPLHTSSYEEQIYTTQAKSQWIVGQSPLSHLQYLDAFKSSTRDLSFQIISLLFSDKFTILFKDCKWSPFEFEQETCLHACYMCYQEW